MNWEQVLIHEENENGPKFVLITDDHKSHIKSHLRLIFKPGMLNHIFQHLMLYVRAKRLSLPKISLEDIIKSQKNTHLK